MQPCEGCEKCQTTFAQHPDHHQPLIPHDWGVMYNQHTGKPYKRCKRCSYVEPQSYEKARKK